MDSCQRRDQALRDLEKIREQPYDEFEDFQRWALVAADDSPSATAPGRAV